MVVSIEERKRHIRALARRFEEFAGALRQGAEEEASTAFEEEELTDMLVAVTVGLVKLLLTTAQRCGATDRMILAKIRDDQNWPGFPPGRPS